MSRSKHVVMEDVRLSAVFAGAPVAELNVRCERLLEISSCPVSADVTAADVTKLLPHPMEHQLNLFAVFMKMIFQD